MEKKALCFIPARGGSKRTPRKNILPLDGKPLFSYTVEAAIQSDIFSKIVVSSDDEQILEKSIKLGVSIDERPAQLSLDTTRAVEVLHEYLSRESIKKQFNVAANLLPTCPFRTADDICNAFDIFWKYDAKYSVIAVTEFDFPPQLAIKLEENNHDLKMINPSQFRKTTRSQDLGKSYHPNGAIYISSIERYLREKTFFVEPLKGYLMPPERSFDID